MSPPAAGRTLWSIMLDEDRRQRDDAALLRECATSGSRAALGELARRHAGMVYAIARRLVGDPYLAEDVTQAVFIVLLQKACELRDEAHLVGWLHTTTRHAAANARKMEQRRKYYEARAGHAAIAQRDELSREKRWEELSPVIDAALADLGERDRQAILLRYICGRGVAEVAAATNVTPGAAKKRLRRGLEKLRAVLARRGVLIPGTLLASTLLAQRASHGVTGTIPTTFANLLNGSSGAAAGSSKAIAIAAQTASHAARWPAIAAAAVIALAAALVIWFALDRRAPLALAAQAEPIVAKPNQAPVAPAPPAATEPASNITAAGQLVALPGGIVGSPTPVDLDGDGEPEIVLPYMGMVPDAPGSMTGYGPLASGREPDLAAYVGAFHLDGSPVAGFPVTIMSAEHHKQAAPNEFPNWWLGTPAVLAARNGQSGVIVIGHPSGPAKADRGVSIIRGDGSHLVVAPPVASPDPGSTLMLVDLDPKATGDATVVLGAATVCTLDGRTPTAWNGRKPPPAGFSCSAGDLNGDGQIEMFLVTQRHGSANASVVAMDHAGKPLPGWPQKVGKKSFAAPSLGNVFGDDKLEVIVPDFREHLLAWTCDGKRFGNTFEEAEGHSYDGGPGGLSANQLQQEKCTSIFKDHINCAGPAALADLDGDGRAEIIVVDANAATLRAWHGDGSPAFAGDADGVVAHLNGQGDVFGVSVAGPDDNGGFDFFAGNSWVHRDRDGHVNVREMIERGSTPGAKIDTICQDTICDIDGDGSAEVLIGTADGRVIIFHTGLNYTPRWAQWPMLGANLQRTGCWRAASPNR
jgi:RNA polymerase sigma factor (sigma-70 family)